MTRIEVTQEDIDKGITAAFSCPIALACNRVSKYRVGVGGSDVQFFNDKEPVSKEIPLPGRAVVFRRCFDWGDIVHPFSFDLDIPQELLR